MHDTTDAPSADAPVSGLTRRSVVRAGTTAAWAVPLVTVATASPALAVSPGNAELQLTGFHLHREPRQVVLAVDIHGIRNTGTTPSGQVTVVVRVPETRYGAFSEAPRLVSGPGRGWTFVGVTGDGPWDFSFISNTGIAPKRSAPELEFRLKLANNKPSPKVNITAVASAQGAESDAASRPVRWVPGKR